MKKIIKYFQDTVAELKKVIWPSREEVFSSTRVVIFTIFLVAIALGILDILLFQGVDFIFSI
jgi:preprotein translocase subunit SecE